MGIGNSGETAREEPLSARLPTWTARLACLLILVRVRVLIVSSEVYPYSKTGGLGDVVGSLPAALIDLGHEVLVVSPWYASLEGEPFWIGDIEFSFDGVYEAAGVGRLDEAGVQLAFVGHEDFRRDSIYGYSDDVRRFCRFTRAAPQVAERLGFTPDLVHVHDWHSAYLPALLRYSSALPPGFRGTPSVLTIHNAQYQGVSEQKETMRWLGLESRESHPELVHHGYANALGAGVALADRITTVSPSYAKEILTPRYGYGLESVLHSRRDDLSGILNGIDTTVWDPSSDPHLPIPYSADEPAGKREAKHALCRRARLDPERPLIGVVSRLAEQKGIDIFLEAAEELRSQGWSIYLLGTGDVDLERRAGQLEAEGLLTAELAFDEALAHLVYAGADLLAIPSRFEPCGLSQMVAMTYGTLPLARATGGLRDTISHGETGFLFEEAEPRALVTAAAEAKRRYGTPSWAKMMSAAMRQDFSWTHSARSYEELYRGLGSIDE